MQFRTIIVVPASGAMERMTILPVISGDGDGGVDDGPAPSDGPTGDSTVPLQAARAMTAASNAARCVGLCMGFLLHLIGRNPSAKSAAVLLRAEVEPDAEHHAAWIDEHIRQPEVWRARIAGHMAGQLFLRSYERSDRIYNAMLARGYKGELMTIHPHQFQARDWLICAISLSGMIIMQFTGRL